VLQPPHNHSVQRLLWQLQSSILLETLDIHQGADQRGVQRSLIGKPIDVLGCVGIDVLEGPSELIVEPLNKRHSAAGNLEDLSLSNGRRLFVVLPLFRVFHNNNVFCALEGVEKLDKLLLCAGEKLVVALTRISSAYSFHCS
jgi:hypothetical protein